MDTATIQCPECGTSGSIHFPAERAADEFCDECGYPLFWAPQVDVPDEDDGVGLGVKRRPGAAGFETLGGLPCPTCRELNAHDAVFCVRCGNPMVLPAEPEPEPIPEPVAALVPVPVPAGAVVATAIFVILAAVVLALWTDP